MLLLQHLDDIDDIITACQRRVGNKPIHREAFHRIVSEALEGRPMTRSNADFLFNCFDKNHDGKMTASELVTVLNDFKTKADRRFESGESSLEEEEDDSLPEPSAERKRGRG